MLFTGPKTGSMDCSEEEKSLKTSKKCCFRALFCYNKRETGCFSFVSFGSGQQTMAKYFSYYAKVS